MMLVESKAAEAMDIEQVLADVLEECDRARADCGDEYA